MFINEFLIIVEAAYFQVSPLTEVEKILDCEMRLTVADKNDSTKFFSSQTKVKQYLVKWKGFSYLHCTWYLNSS